MAGIKSSKRMFLVKVGGLEGTWQKKTGGNQSSDVTKVYDGGAPDPDLITSPSQSDNVTVTRTYQNSRDASILSSLRQQVGRYIDTLSVTATDADFNAVSEPIVYSNAVLVGINEPEPDSGSGDPADFDLVFAVGSVR
jgi:hypothetical protein